MGAIEQNYKDIPYHNQIHAADVTHTMMHFCKSPLFAKNMTDLDRLSSFIAAFIHDVAHTGQNNDWHINASTDLALTYNDRSVLENHSVSVAFKILKDPKNSFLENLSKSEYKYVRDTIVDMVLGTDLFYHQKQMKKLKQFTNIIKAQEMKEVHLKILAKDTIPRFGGILNEKRFVMEIALHMSDVSSPGKKLSASLEWTKRVTQEFFVQGDMEREANLPISPGCDRNNKSCSNIAKQSIGFIDYIVYPIFKLYYVLDPHHMKKFIDGIKRTRNYWKSQM